MWATSIAKLAAVAAVSVLISACNGSDDEPAASTDDPPEQVAKPPGGSTAPKNSAPVIGGSPGTAVTVSSNYEFRPTASDGDGDALSFSVANKPAWAAFDAATGRLSGSPTAADVGIYANIQLTVSDGKVSSALPSFSITVAKGFTDPGFDKDADFQARVAYSKAWYANNFSQYASLAELMQDGGSVTEVNGPQFGVMRLNTDPRFVLSGGKSYQSTMTPTSKQGAKWRQQFYEIAPPGPQKDGDNVREFYVQYAIYWTREAMTWTHRDAQTGENYKTLLLEGYGNGQLMPGMLRRTGVISMQVNGESGCSREVVNSRGTKRLFLQSSLDDPSVVPDANSKIEDYIAKHGMTAAVRDDSVWGYVRPNTDWSYKGRWATGGDWTKNLIDHPDRGHPYGGWGWPELRKPAGYTPWVVDGWTVVEMYVRQDPTIIGYSAEGKPQYKPQTFRVWAAPYGEPPRLIIDSESAKCSLGYNATNYRWFELTYYDTNIVEGGGFGAKVDARTFQPTTTQFEIIHERGADDRPKGHPFYAVENPGDKTLGEDHEFMGNRVGFNTGDLKEKVFTIVDSHYVGMVQDGVDAEGKPIMKRKTRLTVEPMPVVPAGGVGNAESFDTVGDFLQVQTFAEEGYRPPLDIYYDELLMSYEPIPFPGHLDKPLPTP
jgi:hypothetical protein